MKKMLSAALALLLLALGSVPAMAYGNTASTEVYMEQASDDIVQISVTVPLKLVLEPVFDETTGVYYARSPESYGVTNNGQRLVTIQSISMSMEEGYSLIRKEDAEAGNPTSKQLVVMFGMEDKGVCETEAAAGAQNVVVSALPNSEFSSVWWKVDAAGLGDDYKPIDIYVWLFGGLDPTWFGGETKLFTVTYTFGLTTIEEEVM